MRRVTPAYSQSGTTPQAIAPTRAEPIIHGPMATRDFVPAEPTTIFHRAAKPADIKDRAK